MFKLIILAPDKVLFDDSVNSVKLPGASGSFMVLERHAPIISSLVKGTIVCKDANEEREFKINGGFVEVLNNVVSVCIE